MEVKNRMPRARKNATPAMKDAEIKIAGMKSIKVDLDLENGVSVAEGEELLAENRKAIQEYNTLLAAADEKLNVITANDKLLRAFNKKVLPAVGLKYGTDSNEYEKVGGIRESERKKPVRKVKPNENK